MSLLFFRNFFAAFSSCFSSSSFLLFFSFLCFFDFLSLCFFASSSAWSDVVELQSNDGLLMSDKG